MTIVPPPLYFGLDLGQRQDPSALVAMEQIRPPMPPAGPPGSPAPVPGPARYAVRGLKRWPIGTSYVQIVDDTFKYTQRASCVLVVDQTGVGRAVVDMFRLRILVPLWPITITAGLHAAEEPDGWRVPKKDLVSVLQVLLGARRLGILKTLPEAALLERELQNFRVKITAAANETYGAWREGEHDDLVLAVALAAWVAEYTAAGWDGLIGTGEPGLVAGAPAGVFMADKAAGPGLAE